MHGAPNYSPFQILDAGQRAEADGQRAYAIQFYQHLVEHYGETREAQFAHQRLAHLTGQPSPTGPMHHHSNQVSQPNQVAPPYSSADETPRAPRAQPVQGQQLAVSHGPASSHVPLGSHGPTGSHGNDVAHQPASLSHSGEPVQHRPARSSRAAAVAPVRGYMVGRGVARVMSVSGGITILCALFALTAAGAVQFGLLKLAALGVVAIVLPVSGYGLAVGVVMVFVGQFARASFDTADATQELVAMARASAGGGGRH
jgi:hypothetical protein